MKLLIKRFIRQPIISLLKICLIFMIFLAQSTTLFLYIFQSDQLESIDSNTPALSVIYGNGFYINGYTDSFDQYQTLLENIDVFLNDIKHIDGVTKVSSDDIYYSHYILPCQINSDGETTCLRIFTNRYTKDEINQLIIDTTTFITDDDPCHQDNSCPISNVELTIPLYGVTNGTYQMQVYTNMRISEGRGLNQSEISNGQYVCLIPEGLNIYQADTQTITQLSIGDTIPLSTIQNGNSLKSIELTVIGKYTPAIDYLGYVDQSGAGIYGTSSLPQKAIIVPNQVAMDMVEPLLANENTMNIYTFGQINDQFVHANYYVKTHPIIEWSNLTAMRNGINTINTYLDKFNEQFSSEYIYFTETTDTYLEPLYNQYQTGQTIFLLLFIIFELLGILILILMIYSDTINDRHTIFIYSRLGSTKKRLTLQRTAIWMIFILTAMILAILITPLMCHYIVDQFYRIDPMVLPTILKTGIGHFIDLDTLITLTQNEPTYSLIHLGLFTLFSLVISLLSVFMIQRKIVTSSFRSERSKIWN